MLKKYFKISTLIALVCLLIGIVGTSILGGITALSHTLFSNSYLDNLGFNHSFQQVFPYNPTSYYSSDSFLVDIDVNNAKITVIQSTSSSIEADISSSLNIEEAFIVTETDDMFSISSVPRNFFFPFGSPKSEIILKLPSDFDGVLNIKTSNGSITVKNQEHLDHLSLQTSNGTIVLDNINSKNDITAKTSNGKFSVSNLTANNLIYLKTSNGALNVKDTNAKYLEAKSSNGSFNGNNIYAKDINIKTSNASIYLENEDMNYEIENLYTKTSNGKERITANYLNRY